MKEKKATGTKLKKARHITDYAERHAKVKGIPLLASAVVVED